ncbi:MAG TPA: hypothetical protein VF950_10020 [Planctomycetota bacterium]
MRRVAVFGLLCLAAAPQDPPDFPDGVFPATNPWNWDISGFAVHPGSDAYIAAIGASTFIREDYAFPYSVVLNAQADVAVAFNLYEDESDPGPLFGSPADGTLSTGSQGMYPIPAGAPIEGGGDAHCLVIDQDNRLLYETYVTTGGPPWSAACGAVWDLDGNAVRPEGWTSADAAGLPIFPGLIRYDEAQTDTIDHALRFTCSPTQNRHIYPARHHAGQADTALPPMGLRVRLKAGVDLSGFTGHALAIAKALKKHGMILADNGSDWYISTTIDSRWGANIRTIRSLKGSDFEVVVSVNAAGGPILAVPGGGTGPVPPPDPPTLGGGGGGGGGGGCGCTGLELLLLLAFVRRRALL